MNTRRLAIFGLLAAAVVAAPSSAQVSSRERARFAQAHGQVLQQFGGAYTGPGVALAQRVGRDVAIAAGLSRSGSDCTVTVLNTDVVNALAIPGCYVYVTRGLMALMNDEAELASVLGHEIGHVAARHAQKRQGRSMLAGVGALAASVLTGSSTVGNIAGQLGTLSVLGYSRGQEYEADKLGVQYLIRAGYDPYASADMLESLSAEERLRARVAGGEGEGKVPAWARSHPLTEDRVGKARALARAAAKAPDPARRGTAAYLAGIDGMIYGDDPAQGFVNGREFAHPQMRIAFRAPPGFILQNTPAAVLVRGPNGEQAQFGGGALRPREPVAAYAERLAAAFVGDARVQAGPVQERQVNGLEAAFLPLRASTQRGVVDVTVAAYEAEPGRAYHFLALAPANVGDGAIRQLLASFRRLSAADAAALKPRVIEVAVVRSGETVEMIARRQAFTDLTEERFRVLNDLEPNDRLAPGRRVKLVRFAAR